MLKPTGKNFLMTSVTENEAGGLVLPDALQKKRLVIFAVADGSEYKKGQEVVIDREARISMLKYEEREYLIANESEIICIVEPDKKKK